MTKNLKKSLRNKIIAVAALLVILSAVLIIMRHGRTDNPTNENQSIPAGQSANRQKSGIENQNSTTTASKNQSLESQQSQLDKSGMPNTVDRSKRSSTPIPARSFIMQQNIVYKVDPVYPEVAKSTGLNGIVELYVTIDKNGAVTEVNMIRGDALFKDAAVDAVRQWRYEPALVGGVKTPVSFYITVIFNNGTVRVQPSPPPQLQLEDANFVNFITDAPSDNSIRSDISRDDRWIGGNEGYTYYPVTSDMAPPVIQIDKQRIRNVIIATFPNDARVSDVANSPLLFYIMINENGNIDKVQSTKRVTPFPPIVVSALEKELPNYLRVQSPTRYNGKAIPSWITLTIDVPEIIR